MTRSGNYQRRRKFFKFATCWHCLVLTFLALHFFLFGSLILFGDLMQGSKLGFFEIVIMASPAVLIASAIRLFAHFAIKSDPALERMVKSAEPKQSVAGQPIKVRYLILGFAVLLIPFALLLLYGPATRQLIDEYGFVGKAALGAPFWLGIPVLLWVKFVKKANFVW